jgi:hypothetical protein
MGFLVREHALTIDNVLAAELVTADSELLNVDEHVHPDLFWGPPGAAATSVSYVSRHLGATGTSH